ncbi:protein DNA-DAMAGE INDUCIBLE 1-like [Rutidosis leptorrhynchoides]|uniref:protein DNA-DAMAGE INDUCIBLE 1-like n=1 Tax=Rutidosis leptorrhynchoides TaxID=125765 RepID=UPI003A9925B7
MKITVMTADEQIITLEVDPNESVENLKALLEIESRVPLQQQQLLFNGKEMRNAETLSGLGVVDGDLVMMVSNTSSSRVSSNEVMNPDGSAVNPAAFQQQIRNNSDLMAQLFQSDPELAQIILGNDLNKLQDLLRMRHRQRSDLSRQQEEEMALLYADPFDVEAQRKIEAAIRQKGIDENWAAALEHNPEAFARVVMLYVDMEVNGVPIKAFVDSGAQSTIISKTCAERLGLLRLLDQRYKGIAHGVGQSEILGRIHVAPIKIGSNFYPCSFVVLDSPNMDFLFGLDMLRKHQCTIDLKDNVLRVGGGEVAVPFLPEKDIPRQFLDEEKLLKEASSSGAQTLSASAPPLNNTQTPSGGPSSGSDRGVPTQGPEFEAKIAKLVELGFSREAVIQALKFFDGNEEQAAGYLFGG